MRSEKGGEGGARGHRREVETRERKRERERERE